MTLPATTASAFPGQPWLQTRPTDWGSRRIAKASREYQQKLKRQCEREYQLQQIASQQYLNRLTSDRISDLENSRSATGRRGGYVTRGGTTTRGGSTPHGVILPSRDLQAGEYKIHLASMRRAWNSPELRGELDRQQKLDIWFNHAPNISGQLPTILMPKHK